MSSVTNIRQYINDASGVTFPDQYLYDAMNDSLLDLHIDSKPTLTSTSWALSTGTELVALPASIMIPQMVIYSGKPYYFSSQVELERYSPKWRSEGNAQPRWFVRWDSDQVRIWPKPNINYTMTLWGLGWPTEITSTSTTIDTDSHWRQAVEHKTTSILLELARPDLAKIHEIEYQIHRDKYNVGLRNAQGHRLRTLRPATRNNKAQSGSISIGRVYK